MATSLDVHARIDAMDLPYLPVDTPEFAADPFTPFAAAREQHPWLAKAPFGYYITDHAAIIDLFRNRERQLDNPYSGMLDMMDAAGTPWGRFQASHILNQSGEAHKRLRTILNPAFTPREAKRQRPLMREVISDLLDEWVPKGAFDFEEFASYFPITVMCKLIGASPDAIPPLRSSLEALGLSVSMDKKHLPALQQGTITIDDFSQKLVAERRAGTNRPAEQDLLDVLLEAQAEGGLTDRELYDLLIFLFAAGYDTSKNILTLIMVEIIQRPDVYQRCAADLAYCKKVAEETFRFHSTAGTLRLVAEDMVYRGVLIPAGTMLWMPINIAARDPRVSSDPDSFDPDRDDKVPQIAFGLGAHICLGQFIARAQIEEGLHLITQRLRNPTSPGPAGYRPFPGVWGLKGLPIRFEPGEAREAELA